MTCAATIQQNHTILTLMDRTNNMLVIFEIYFTFAMGFVVFSSYCILKIKKRGLKFKHKFIEYQMHRQISIS